MARTAVKKDAFENSPWDDAPEQDSVPAGDEAQAEIVDVPVSTEKEKVVVVGTEGGKITVTLKGGTGYDEPWIVIHGTDAEDILGTMSEESFTKLLAWTKAAAEKFHGGSKAAPAGNTQAGKPAAATSAPGGREEFCKHGKMEFKSFISKAGKPTQLFGCTSPNRDEQCKGIFVN
jgi:hypothetical protein